MNRQLIISTKTFASMRLLNVRLNIRISIKRMPEAFIFTSETNSKSMNKKLVLIILVIVIIVGISATLIAVNPSSTIIPIPTPTSLHNKSGSSSNLHRMTPG
ncbi:MAG: hypothetical protein WA395_11605 [Nitrososphaeraceae archaeon]|jgi:hypothetical protein